ncbi:glycogenin glucosyltransferase [Rhodotorula kratochvilovae]
MDPPRFAFATLVTSDQYLPGALVTLHSLLDIEPASPLQRDWTTVCLTTPATVGYATLQALTRAFDVVVGVESIVTQSWEELKLLGRRDLAATLTKLHLFRLTQYEKVVFLDADTLVVRPLSHLFQLPHRLSAAPDQGWPDAFNSGVLVATPSLDTFDALMDMMRSRGTWDGGDQGLLNDFFPDWHRLSFTYNVTPSAYYTYAPAYKRHGQDVSVLHFIGADKPWNRGSRAAYDPDAASKDYYGLVGQWYDVFERHYGSISTYDVADRVTVPPKSFLRKEFTSLPLLPKFAKPSLASPSSSSAKQPLPVDESALATPATPTISVAPPSPPRPVAISSSGRAPSPPHLTWDPARSSPPRGGPLQMRDAIPSTANMWDDDVPLSTQRARFEPPSAYPAPPRETHDWYKDVMRSRPDPSKVRPVFPWEEPAQPESAALPPVVPAPTRTFADEPAQPSAPPPRFAGGGGFSNAWDSVPGIKRYAQQLAKRHGHARKSSTGKVDAAQGSAPSSGEGSAAEKRPGHRRSRSGSSATAGGRTPRAKEATLGGAVGGEAGRPASMYSKDGDASSRDGDDEDDEDVSTSSVATTEDADGDEDEDEDDAEGIDRITIRFRRALKDGELDPTNLQRGKKSGSPSSNEGNDTPTISPPAAAYYAGSGGGLPPKSPRDAPAVPTSPTKTRRDSRYVPTSPRQPRTPQLAHAPFAAAAGLSSSGGGPSTPKPALRLQLPTTPGGTALSPRLAAQALRNSTAARLTASGAGGGDGPPVVRATRVFSPETDTGVVKQQGLAALQRFVENMESMQAQAQQFQQGGDGAGSGGASMW